MLAVNLHDHKPRDIPQFVGKIPKTGNFFFGQLHIVARRIADKQRQAGGIGAVFGNHIQRIYYIAQRFAHFSPLLVAHQAVQINSLERNIAQNISSHKNHSGHPEK